MSDSAVDKATFAFLATCVGDFVRWPQCGFVDLRSYSDSGSLSMVRFKARATNSADRTVFKITVMKDDDWRVRIVQVSNHILLDECITDRDTIVNAVNLFMGLAGMREGRES